MLINQKAFDGQECPYHVIDWKSSKLPRVTRSSLGAEAQAAGQAEDSVDFICRFWECLKDHRRDPGRDPGETFISRTCFGD